MRYTNQISFSNVKAEEIIENNGAVLALIPQDSGTLNTPISRLSAITEAEAARQADERRAGRPATDASNDSRDSSVQDISKTETAQQAKEAATGGEVEGAVYSPLDLPAFDVSPEELEQLALQIKAESHQDTPTYLLDMLKVIAASEKSADVLFELLGLFREIFESLIDEGNWKQLNSDVDKLREVHRRGDMAEEQKKAVPAMLDSLHGRTQMDAMASRLNADPHVATENLLGFLLHLPPNA